MMFISNYKVVLVIGLHYSTIFTLNLFISPQNWNCVEMRWKRRRKSRSCWSSSDNTFDTTSKILAMKIKIRYKMKWRRNRSVYNFNSIHTVKAQNRWYNLSCREYGDNGREKMKMWNINSDFVWTQRIFIQMKTNGCLPDKRNDIVSIRYHHRSKNIIPNRFFFRFYFSGVINNVSHSWRCRNDWKFLSLFIVTISIAKLMIFQFFRIKLYDSLSTNLIILSLYLIESIFLSVFHIESAEMFSSSFVVFFFFVKVDVSQTGNKDGKSISILSSSSSASLDCIHFQGQCGNEVFHVIYSFTMEYCFHGGTNKKSSSSKSETENLQLNGFDGEE